MNVDIERAETQVRKLWFAAARVYKKDIRLSERLAALATRLQQEIDEHRAGA